MKRLLTSVFALFLIFSVQASAQVKFGVTGGMNFNTAKFTDVDVESKTGWNAGVTMLLDLPLGLSVQPSLVYSQKNANITKAVSQNMGYLELPVSVQWGPDLLVFRPFVDVTPYVGYAIMDKTKLAGELGEMISTTVDVEDLVKTQKFEYGIGLGGGINVWKLQVVARYCWNFGPLFEDLEELKAQVPELNKGSKNFGGVMVNVAFFF